MSRYHIGLVLVLGTLMTGRVAAAQSDGKVSLLSIDPVVENIKPGMTRLEIESKLTDRDGGPQSINSTRYYRSAGGLIIEVPYDQTGGTWASTNRVNGPVSFWPGSRNTL